MLQNALNRGGVVLFLLGNCPKGLQTLLDELVRYLAGAPTRDDPRCSTCVNLLVGLAMAFLGEAEWDAALQDGRPRVMADALRRVLAAYQWDRTVNCSCE